MIVLKKIESGGADGDVVLRDAMLAHLGPEVFGIEGEKGRCVFLAAAGAAQGVEDEGFFEVFHGFAEVYGVG